MSAILNLRMASIDKLEYLLSHPNELDFYLSYERNPPAPGEFTDLDKSWHGLHFLFTENILSIGLPDGFLLNGGQQISDFDRGYGPVRYLSSFEVGQVLDFLSNINDQVLFSRFDPRKMDSLQIYPEFWKDIDFEYLSENFHNLLEFVTKANSEDKYIIIWLS